MKLILFLISFLYSSHAYSEIYNFEILRVIDGDTIEFSAPFLPLPLKPYLHLRVLNVDTPEKSPKSKCDKENELAQKATIFTKTIIQSSSNIKVEIIKWDKFGGRILGDVIIDERRLSELLIENHLARPYYGEAKSSWCG